MSNGLAFLRANPGLMIATSLGLAAILVLSLIGGIMARAGASLRPIVFFGGFFAIILVPQVLFHAGQAFGWIPRRDLTWTCGNTATSIAVRQDYLTVRDHAFTQPTRVFGAQHDADLVSDLRERMPDGLFAQAEAAQMAIVPPAASVMVARFSNADAARDAGLAYMRAMTGTVPSPEADGSFWVNRVYDVMKVLVVDGVVLAWSGPDQTAVDEMVASSPLLAPRASETSATVKSTGNDYWLYRPVVAAGLLLALLLIASAWFFRMSTWASAIPAVPTVSPLDVFSLKQRLLAVNSPDVPFTIDAMPGDSSRLVATWRYADARWVDLARARGLRRTYRIILAFDEAAHTVRPVEQHAQYDWSVGAGGAAASWRSEQGIIFFQHDRHRVFGLPLDSNGRVTRDLSYAWRFDVREIKSPLIQSVTTAGWEWRPTVGFMPRWLHWLTGG